MTKIMDISKRNLNSIIVFSLFSVLILSDCSIMQGSISQDIENHPNVLFIAIDDLNDWVGCLNGHPQVKTPNIDKLANMGILFSNAHAQAPLCNPSRTSVLTGLRPSTTGIYGLSPWFREVKGFEHIVSLPQNFSNNGYTTFASGKVYHGNYGQRAADYEFDYFDTSDNKRILPNQKLVGTTPGGNHLLMDWGTFAHKDEDKQDWKTASWSIEVLNHDHPNPFFLAVGFKLPHVPLYTTEKWFDLYPYETLQIPPILEGDRNDTPKFSWYNHWKVPEPRLKWLEESDQLKSLVRSYLAAISFVDSQVGRVLEALEKSKFKDNTIIVLWSDHGYHLGEKEISGKNTLWERSTHVPLIFAGPGIEKAKLYTQPVELLDIYPTLNELCHLTPIKNLEGMSLMPFFDNTNIKRNQPAITTDNYKNHGIRTKDWHYIQYANKERELYNLNEDPNEWHNLGLDETYRDIIDSLSLKIPVLNHLPVIGNGKRILNYENGVATWEGTVIHANDPIPDYD